MAACASWNPTYPIPNLDPGLDKVRLGGPGPDKIRLGGLGSDKDRFSGPSQGRV